MNYRHLGRQGVRVSEVGLGNWLTQGRTLDDATTKSMVHRAFDLGINFFDTADIYSKGASELALGKAIQGLRREDLFIASKCFWPMTDAPNDRGLSRKHIVESVEGSLKRLGVDYIDLFQFHRFDASTPIEESIRAADDLIRAGKILYWGVSMWSPDQIISAVWAARALNVPLPASNQPEYSMLVRDIEERVMPVCADHGLGLVVWSPLAQGVLTGKYLPGQPAPSDSRAVTGDGNSLMQRFMEDDTLTRVQKLKALVEGHGYGMAEFALAWCLRKREVSSTIVGAASIAQLEANVRASELAVRDEVWQEAGAILNSGERA